MNDKNAAWIIGVVLAYRVILFGGVAYLVEWHGWSAWWFLAALMVAGSLDSKQDESTDDS